MLKKIFTKLASLTPFYREFLQLINLQKRIKADLDTLIALESNRLLLEMERNPRYQDPLRLQKYVFQVNSQNGEDGIIQEIFRRIGAPHKTFVEIGVGDGAQNNTAFLLAQGWQGAWIDADTTFLKTIESRPDLQGEFLKCQAAFVSRENVLTIFEKLGVPVEFDFFSLDVDQNTYYVWEALAKYRPRVVLVEYNASIPPAVNWKVNYLAERVWDGSQNFGASLAAYEELGRRLGYVLVGCDYTGSNAFFVREDLAGDKFAPPFTAENHFEPPRYGLVRWRGARRTAILDRAKPVE
ncbi:MAG: hypothetical protein IT310_05050 [Anaerolineales bacterium]|nr:hypothetical protein [Anaerolineales bacterium]